MGTPHRKTRGGLTLALLFLACGCGGALQDTPSPFDERGGTTSLELSVDNQNFNNVRLTVESIRGRRMVGRVSGSSRGTFRIPWAGVHELTIRIEILSGGEYVSNRVTASAGDRLELLVASDPRSSVLRRRR
jgi:hypothetical protein